MAKVKTNGNDSDDSGEEGHGNMRKRRISDNQKAEELELKESDQDVTTTTPLTTATENHGTTETASKEKRNIRRELILTALAFVIVILVIVVIYLATRPTHVPYCTYRDEDYVKPRDLENPDVFDDLTPGEFNAVRNYLKADASLNIKEARDATVNSAYIYMVHLFLPDKSDVVQYLDHKGSKPQRIAKAIIVRGDKGKPVVEEYLVYPAAHPRTIELYNDPSFRRQPIPYTSRPVDPVDYANIFSNVIDEATEQMYPLLMSSYGLCYHNCTKGHNCMKIFDVAPRAYASGERRSWFWFFPDVDGFYINPLGLEMLINHKSTNVSDWLIEKVVYNGQSFDSVDDLMQQFTGDKLKRVHIHTDKPPYSAYKARTSFPDTPQQGPMLFEPEGKRFTVKGQAVKYNKWDFSFNMNPFNGMQIFNAKFNGTRIAYEIGLQEVLVLYTGYGPAQSVTNYYDSGWQLGSNCMELVRGVDCPETAIYLDTHSMGETSKNSICIFENNGAIPMRRHYANDFEGGYSFYGGVADYHLVIRTVTNVWNYDYIFDYIFYNNGAIEVKASATGYVQSAFSLPGERKYGSLIHDRIMADLHLHIFNYKVDLDIAGEKNRFTTLNLGLESFSDPWMKGSDRQRMKIHKVVHKSESKTSVVDAGKLQYHLIQNTKAKNEHGAPRSYRILNKAPLLNILSNYDVVNAAKWSKYPVIVTQRKESERQSSSVYAQNDPWNPVLDFDDFLDNESLLDEDLVAWVTMGTHHIPGSEDVPSTPTTWNQYSFFLTPHNYFDEDPSRDSRDTVVIRSRGRNHKPYIETNGQSFKATCIAKNKGPFEFDGFRR